MKHTRLSMVQLYELPDVQKSCDLLARNLPIYSAKTLGQHRRSTLRLELLQSSCDLDCRCDCHGSHLHHRHCSRTGLVACLLNGYSARPISSRDCNRQDCQSQSSKITYAFPAWFWYRALFFSASLNYRPGPELCLRLMRVRPRDAESFRAAYDGDTSLWKQLLISGKASVLDVDPTGLTALHVSLQSAHFFAAD